MSEAFTILDAPKRNLPLAMIREGAAASRASVAEGSTASGRGRLKNGNPAGDFLSAPRCGAHTRSGHACRQPAMENGRCRLHGGKRTGPTSEAGLERSRRARLVHGARSAELAALRAAARRCAHRIDALVRRARGVPAGHEVDRPFPGPARWTDGPGRATQCGGLGERTPARACDTSRRRGPRHPRWT